MSKILAIKQIDRRLRPYKVFIKQTPPKQGWIATIRQAYGMSAAQLSRIMGVSRARITELEASEKNDATTLKSLKNAAKALNCKFVYAFVPLTPIEKTIQKKARRIAEQRVNTVSHSMSLENQSLKKARNREHVKELTVELLKNPKLLWK